jgi:hypothetical protein
MLPLDWIEFLSVIYAVEMVYVIPIGPSSLNTSVSLHHSLTFCNEWILHLVLVVFTRLCKWSWIVAAETTSKSMGV